MKIQRISEVIPNKYDILFCKANPWQIPPKLKKCGTPKRASSCDASVYNGNLPIAAVILEVVRIITFGDDFNLSIWVSKAFTTWDAISRCIKILKDSHCAYSKIVLFSFYSYMQWKVIN